MSNVNITWYNNNNNIIMLHITWVNYIKCNNLYSDYDYVFV